jgi:hypothetical protein
LRNTAVQFGNSPSVSVTLHPIIVGQAHRLPFSKKMASGALALQIGYCV